MLGCGKKSVEKSLLRPGLVGLNYVCVTRIVRLKKLQPPIFGERKKLVGADTVLRVAGKALEPIREASTDLP